MNIDSMVVGDYMVQEVFTVTQEQDVMEAIDLFIRKGITGAPVVNERGELIGILSDTDLIKAAMKAGFDPNWRGLVKDFMTCEVETVESHESIFAVAERFLQKRFRRYPVVKDNFLVGQVSRLDVLRAVARGADS